MKSPTLKDVVVYTEAVSTYNLPLETALEIGLTKYAAHPADVTGYMGLYIMAGRGAVLASALKY